MTRWAHSDQQVIERRSIHLKLPNDLSSRELLQIVTATRGLLGVALKFRGGEKCDWHESLGSREVLNEVRRIFAAHDLTAQCEQPFPATGLSPHCADSLQYVVYDPATGDLWTTAVCSSLAEAADAAGYRDDLWVLPLRITAPRKR